jgi:hypothetical protein
MSVTTLRVVSLSQTVVYLFDSTWYCLPSLSVSLSSIGMLYNLPPFHPALYNLCLATRHHATCYPSSPYIMRCPFPSADTMLPFLLLGMTQPAVVYSLYLGTIQLFGTMQPSLFLDGDYPCIFLPLGTEMRQSSRPFVLGGRWLGHWRGGRHFCG